MYFSALLWKRHIRKIPSTESNAYQVLSMCMVSSCLLADSAKAMTVGDSRGEKDDGSQTQLNSGDPETCVPFQEALIQSAVAWESSLLEAVWVILTGNQDWDSLVHRVSFPFIKYVGLCHQSVRWAQAEERRRKFIYPGLKTFSLELRSGFPNQNSSLLTIETICVWLYGSTQCCKI